jgi:hypothetical protein
MLHRLDSISAIERAKLAAQLGMAIKEVKTAATAGQRARAAIKIPPLLAKIGAAAPKPPEPKPPETDTQPPTLPDGTVKVSTAKFFTSPDRTTKGQRQRDNNAAIDLLKQLKASGEKPTDEQKAILAKYSGNGGNLVGADGLAGSFYEYYTPPEIASGVWDLLKEMGFAGGKVLDPSAGTGIFGATSPDNAAIDAVELDETSGEINRLVNGGPGSAVTIAPFEKVAVATDDETYDAVVTNVPFGDVASRGANAAIDPQYKREPLESYFILRSLRKLKPGGLAAFICSASVVGKGNDSNKKMAQCRLSASLMAEFLGAYRLPNMVFANADADTITDVIVFRKFTRDTATKIDELRQQHPEVLQQANVLWEPFLEGKYFLGEGKRFQLGTFVPKNPDAYRDVDRVVADGEIKIGEIAKLMRKFPGSRIDWALLKATETSPIMYKPGDTITMAGQTLEYTVDGQWRQIEGTGDGDDLGLAVLLERMTSANVAVVQNVSFDEAMQCVDAMNQTGQTLTIPTWLRAATYAVTDATKEDKRGQLWRAVVAGMAVRECLDKHGSTQGFNYLEQYPALSERMQEVTGQCKSPESGLPLQIKDAMKQVAIYCNRKTGFNAVWRGETQSLDALGADTKQSTYSRYEKVRYGGANDVDQDGFVSVESLKAALGESFNVADDDWCINDDGTGVLHADDFFSGNYGDMLKTLDKQIQAAPNEEVKAKLLRMKLNADSRVRRTDVKKMRYDLFSPYVPIEQKAEFVRRFVDPRFAVHWNEESSKSVIWFDGPSSQKSSEHEKLLNRFGFYLSGTDGAKSGGKRSITLGGIDVIDPAAALEKLRQMSVSAAVQFDAWVKSNKPLMADIDRRFNAPENLFFNEADSGDALDISGMNPAFKLHDYQNAFARRMARNFSGINGFDVGLGKTLTALASVQYVQSIGVKKKSFFVVPNSVLSNWKREAGRAYTSMDDCLFIGLRQSPNGDDSVKSSAYAEDLTRVLENKHSKIFMTLQAFKKIPLRPDTMADYEEYLQSVDAALALDDKSKKNTIVAQGKIKKVTGDTGRKSGAIPFFEDMGCDSLVCDEAHIYKNSKTPIEFPGAKMLSTPKASQTGRDMQIKCWYIRGKSKLGDGVLSLTATPITNSPVEIYNMLSMAVGEKRVHASMGGIQGVDQFMDSICEIEQKTEQDLTGIDRSVRFFKGLQGIDALRGLLHGVAVVKTAASVNLAMPESDEQQTKVVLTEDVKDTLMAYKSAYRVARVDMGIDKNYRPTPAERAAFEAVKEATGEDVKLIGHPFNLIKKMSAFIADKDYGMQMIVFTFDKAQSSAADKVVAAFNALKITEERPRLTPLSTDADIVGRKMKQSEFSDDKEPFLIVNVKAIVDGVQIKVDSTDFNTQSRFLALAEKANLNLDTSISPKFAAFIENFQREAANPVSQKDQQDGVAVMVPRKFAKQIVFCDHLGLHNKLKLLLTKRCGVSSGKISIISGQTIKDAADMQEIQDGFNADGDENRYSTIIANEKAEVGINLQKGTQAIHHLTIGWTPDSTHQRNGRGVRQGNAAQFVRIYHYDADGTFDNYKRQLVNKKADWIGVVMDQDGADTVTIGGQLSDDDCDVMIDAVGDPEAMRKAIEAMDERAAAAAIAASKERQLEAIKLIEKQNAFIKKITGKGKEGWVQAAMEQAFKIGKDAHELKVGLDNLARISAENKDEPQDVRERRNLRSKAIESRHSELMAMLKRKTDEIQDAAGDLSFTDAMGRKGSVSVAAVLQSELLAKNRTASDFARFNRPVNNTINEDSALIQTYNMEVETAQSMVKAATEGFVQESAMPGTLPAQVLAQLQTGEAIRFADKRILRAGQFVSQKDQLICLFFDSGKLKALMPTTVDRFKNNSAYRANVIQLSADQSIETITIEASPEDANYAEFLKKAAAADDALILAGMISTVEGGPELFSDVLPAVATLVTATKVTVYDYRTAVLPPPFFKWPLFNSHTSDLTGVSKVIADAQAAAINWLAGPSRRKNGSFTLKVDGPLAKQSLVESGGLDSLADDQYARAIFDFAYANGIQIAYADISVHTGLMKIVQERLADTFAQVQADVAGHDLFDTPQAANQWAIDQIASKADWVNFAAISKHSYLAGANLYGQALYDALQAKVAPKNTPQSGVPANVMEMAKSDYIGIRDAIQSSSKFNSATFKLKEWIKEIAKGVGGVPLYSDGQWSIPIKAYKLLLERFPDEMKPIKAEPPLRLPK